MSVNNKQWYGLPLNLIWGYVAIAVFMTGDGFELAFLSHYIKALGFTPAQASFAFTLYGLAAALSAWVSGVVAEIITPRESHADWLRAVVRIPRAVPRLRPRSRQLCADPAVSTASAASPIRCSSTRLSWRLSITSTATTPARRIGWFWAVYSIGIGVFGSYIPSFTIPHIGEMGTLWLALAFCLTGGVIALVSLRHIQTPQHMQNLTTREKFSELGRAATLLYTNRNILLSSMVRIINTLSLFGFAVIMPMMFVDELGFSTSEWLQVWAVFFFTTIFSNVLWGILGEKLGWMKVVRWFGCIGMALSSLAFYYIPQHFGHSFAMALIPAIALGIFVAAFVPLAAVFPALEPKHKGAAISVYNLSAGMSNFLAPAIAVVLLPFFSTIGVVIAYTGLYVVAFFLCAFIRVEQPGFSHKEATAREQVEFS